MNMHEYQDMHTLKINILYIRCGLMVKILDNLHEVIFSNFIATVTLSIVIVLNNSIKYFFLSIQPLNYNYLSQRLFVPNFIKIEHQ